MKILSELQGCRTIGISGHEKPDGDCIGSCMALMLFLRKAMPGARVDVFLERFPEELERNIAGAQLCRHDFITDVESYDAFIVLDCDKTRTAGAEPFFDAAKKTINIDHHVSNRGCADVDLIVPAASSACEVLWDVLDERFVDEEIARDLYIGIVTDTGVFRFSNTGTHTMELAGRLISYGFDFPRIVREVFFEKSFRQQRVMAAALSKARLMPEGPCAASFLTRAEMDRLGAEKEDVDGISAQLALTREAGCAFFMHEEEAGVWRVSLRSMRDVDVSRIASALGGGGHVRAAGCTVRGGAEDIAERIRSMIAEQTG